MFAGPPKRVRFRPPSSLRPWASPHVLVLIICLLLLFGCLNYLFTLRKSDAWWAEYDDDSDDGGVDGGRRSLGRATGVDGEVDAAFQHASHDKQFLADQHHHPKHASGGGQGVAMAQNGGDGGGGKRGGVTGQQQKQQQFVSGRYGSEQQAGGGAAAQQAGAVGQQQQRAAAGQQQQQPQQVGAQGGMQAGGGAGAAAVQGRGGGGMGEGGSYLPRRSPVLVLYTYHEQGVVEKANFEYFLIMAMGIDSRLPQPSDTDFVVGVLGQACEPCSALLPDIEPSDAPPAHLPFYDQVKASDYLTLVFRFEFAGGDMAGHNATLEWAARTNRLQMYSHVIFVSSAARGPFVPSYMPPTWQWTDAFARHLAGAVHGVGSALSCAAPGDPGGAGPRVEQWAFALDREGLQAVLDASVFSPRPCAMCEDGEIIAPPGSVSQALLSRGHNLATLLAMYGPEVDWRDKKHAACNDYIPAGLHGSYDGIDMHPFESMFVPSVAHGHATGEPFTGRYSRWLMQRALGRHGTYGKMDQAKSSYFSSDQALRAADMSLCYPWLKHWHGHHQGFHGGGHMAA